MGINHISLNRTFILELPDELLDAIICAAGPIVHNDWHGSDSFKVYEMGIVLSLVCKRFYRITVPYLYADLVINSSDNAWGERKGVFKKLHRSFRENPSLWPLCRGLIVSYDKKNIGNLYVATDCITWLTAAKTLTFWGLEGRKAWDLLRLAIEQKSSCNSLSLRSTYMYNLELRFVINILGDFKSGFLPNLQTLNLHGISLYGDEICQEALREKAGMAPFTRLELRNFLLTPKTLEGLVRWSRRLEEFELRFTCGDDFSTPGLYKGWTLATLQKILSIHRRTLRSITLYAITLYTIGRPDIDGLDLRQFESLEKLSLSSQISGHQDYKEEETLEPPDGLLAPGLRVFHWDLTLVDQQCSESLAGFSQREENWLRQLARKAIKRGCPLRRIEIKFTPVEWGCNSEVYPWDRMDAIGAELRPHGIEVSYNPPSVSKEQFLKIAGSEGFEGQENPEMVEDVERIGDIMRDRVIVPTP
ncbi:hypothetical protein N7517_010585 [Penicillium concentricum]|uniref:F-box domain-containing protein n=1 Tax=Penicillium concentricum TaxID=293559 RepID=A0A9W9UV82_9EURO|nr:uncharacterized protein N7517_010585 [Penicillium concentricum]KAJ5355976.1 hypothetical protein N7517_010585 [Penicillium concentricum]